MTGFIGASTGAAFALTMLSVSIGHAATAGKAEPDRAGVVRALSDCRKITENGARLACYDQAAAAFDQAESKGQLVVIDREQAKVLRRQAFGFSLSAFNIFNFGEKDDEHIDRLNLQIDHVHRNAEGGLDFITTDGAVWMQTDTERPLDEPEKGAKLMVRTGVLGNFFCQVDHQPAVGCKRVH